MNEADRKHLLSRLVQVRGPEHLAQITTEMSKRMWNMKKAHRIEEDSPIWKPFPGTASLWEALQTHFNLPHTPKRSKGPNSWMDDFNNDTNICWKCQCRNTAVCTGNLCQTPRCVECEKTCSVLNVTPDGTVPAPEHCFYLWRNSGCHVFRLFQEPFLNCTCSFSRTFCHFLTEQHPFHGSVTGCWYKSIVSSDMFCQHRAFVKMTFHFRTVPPAVVSAHVSFTVQQVTSGHRHYLNYSNIRQT
jgi:hypothetical protein